MTPAAWRLTIGGRAGSGRRACPRADHAHFGKVYPADPLNAVIADITLTPRNARGMVEYSGAILIIRPVDATKSSRRLLFENNRGNIL
jgi:hypothetical protein